MAEPRDRIARPNLARPNRVPESRARDAPMTDASESHTRIAPPLRAVIKLPDREG